MYNRDKRYYKSLERVPNWDANEDDKNLVLKFINKLEAFDLSFGRKDKYLFYLRNLCKWSRELGFNFRSATEEDIIRLSAKINSTNYSDDTKQGFKITIKKFYLEVLEKERSDFIDWMYSRRCRVLKQSKNKSKQEIEKKPFSKDDIALLINVSDVMMRALISVAFEGCLRPSEYLLAEIEQLQFEGECYQLQVVGKTGRRHIYLVDSLPYLKDWLRIRPKTSEYLFCNNNGDFLNLRTVDKMFRRICKKANFVSNNQPTFLYWLRHSGITYKRILGYSDEVIIKYAGWTSGRQLRTYSHVTTQYKDEILKKAGLKIESKTINSIKICPRCAFSEIGFSEQYCPKCKCILDPNEYEKQFERQKIYERIAEKLVEIVDVRKLDKEALDLLKNLN